METAGIIIVLIGIWVVRQVSVGRAKNLPEDTIGVISAVFNGKIGDVSGVTSKRGTPETPTTEGKTQVTGSGNPALLDTARKLGNGKPYVWGATGPNAYDCSGLVYASLKTMGKDAGRFDTNSFPSAAKKLGIIQVSTPEIGDIVLWSHHMGIVSGSDQFYSALGKNYGIRESKMSAERGTPSFWRLQ